MAKKRTTRKNTGILQNRVDATDREIYQPVYELYGLTDEEIRVVEQARGD